MIGKVGSWPQILPPALLQLHPRSYLPLRPFPGANKSPHVPGWQAAHL